MSYDCLLFNFPLKNISLTFRQHWRRKAAQCSAPSAVKQGGIFIMSHLLWHRASFLRFHFKNFLNLVNIYKLGILRTYSRLHLHGVLIQICVLFLYAAYLSLGNLNDKVSINHLKCFFPVCPQSLKHSRKLNTGESDTWFWKNYFRVYGKLEKATCTLVKQFGKTYIVCTCCITWAYMYFFSSNTTFCQLSVQL